MCHPWAACYITHQVDAIIIIITIVIIIIITITMTITNNNNNNNNNLQAFQLIVLARYLLGNAKRCSLSCPFPSYA